MRRTCACADSGGRASLCVRGRGLGRGLGVGGGRVGVCVWWAHEVPSAAYTSKRTYTIGWCIQITSKTSCTSSDPSPACAASASCRVMYAPSPTLRARSQSVCSIFRAAFSVSQNQRESHHSRRGAQMLSSSFHGFRFTSLWRWL